MSKTQKQIDEFFKSKKQQEQTLQPRSQMILNDEPLPSSKKKYQKTELDKVLEQFKGIDEWTDEKQLRHRLQIKEKTIDKLNEEIEELKQAIHLYHDELEQLQKREETHKHIVPNLQAWRDRHADTIKEYDKLKSECHKDIEKVWMYDTSIDYSEKNRSLAEKDSKERSKIIERVFYKIANEWID